MEPNGEGDFLGHVPSRARVDLTHLRKMIHGKLASRSDKGRPQPPMNKSDLTVDKATHEDITVVADSSRHREDLVTFRMRVCFGRRHDLYDQGLRRGFACPRPYCRTRPAASTVNANPGSCPEPGVSVFWTSATSLANTFRRTAPVGF